MSAVETVFEATWPWPTWTAVFVLLVLAGAAWLLYLREPANIGRISRAVLVACRLATCALLVWILGGWQRQLHRTEPAHLVIAVDDSASMAFVDEYSDARSRAKLKTLREAIRTRDEGAGHRLGRLELAEAILQHPRLGWLPWFAEHYQVKVRLIADSIRPVTTDPESRLPDIEAVRPASELGKQLRDLLIMEEGQPVAAVIFFTDGVTTSGPSLAEAATTAQQQGIPLFLIGTGGRQQPRDLRLSDLVADDVAFAGDVVQMEVQLSAHGMDGQTTQVRIKHATTGEVLSEEPVKIETNAVRQPVQLSFRPQAVGTLPLAIEAVALPSESDAGNNRLLHSIHVNDVALKVLLVQTYPSYEYRFLKNLLGRATRPTDSSAKAFELTAVLQEADREHTRQDPAASQLFPVTQEELNQYDVVLFGDVDPALLGRSAMENLVRYVREHGGSVVLMAGSRYTPAAYRDTPLAALFPFDLHGRLPAPDPPFTEPFSVRLTTAGALNPACRLLSQPAENAATWSSLPELFWYWDATEVKPGARVLVEHASRVGPDRRPLPLIVTQYIAAGRVVFHAMDETYRWARFQGDDEYYAKYWLQTLRALSRPKLLAGQSLADVSTDRQQYQVGETVLVRVHFRQLPSNPERVSALVEQPNGTRQFVNLQAQESQPAVFTGQVANLSPGNYRVLLSSPVLTPAPLPRSLSIADAGQEQMGVAQDAAGLQQAARISGGKYYDWSQADRLFRDLPRGQPVRVESLPPEPIWNAPVVAALFVALLTTEWVLRKRLGML